MIPISSDKTGPNIQPINAVGIQLNEILKLGPTGKLNICVNKRNPINDAKSIIK